jgi:hypothetical protein
MTLVRWLYAASKILLTSAIIVNVLGFIGKVAATGSIWTGLQQFLGWFNPGNAEAFVTEVALFSPSVFAYLLAERLENRRNPRT